MAGPARKALQPWMDAAIEATTQVWQEDLKLLFVDTRNWFPDTVWETDVDHAVLLGHKAIVRAREIRQSPCPLLTEIESSGDEKDLLARSDGSIFGRVTVSSSYSQFLADIRRLYTGESSPSHLALTPSMESRLEKLRNDLHLVWIGRLYSDVRITSRSIIPDNRSGQNSPITFSAHRFILALRSRYFHNVFSGSPQSTIDFSNEPLTRLTPTSLYFTLGYIYTGTLKFSHREYDLTTAFTIFRGSIYLGIPSLTKLLLAQITVEMLHGLFHATLPNQEYNRVIGSYNRLMGRAWSAMVHLGCRCWQCARRVPRILQLAQEIGVKSEILERGARRALVGLFGEGWCTQYFSALPQTVINSILTEFQKMITPADIFPMLFAAERALIRLNASAKPWTSIVRPVIISAPNRKPVSIPKYGEN